MYQTIRTLVNSLSDQIITDRREYHRYPETALEEYITSENIARTLKDLGYTVYEGTDVCGYQTGVIGEMNCPGTSFNGFSQSKSPDITANKPPVIALRFDIDGLATAEDESSLHIPAAKDFASRRPGYMHACGHDGHIAIGLGCARVLAQIAHKLNGTIRLIFQPGEEGCKGGRAITNAGWLDDVDYFLAGHIVPRSYVQSSSLPDDISDNCNIIPVSGSLATTKLDAFFTGRSCHGATPEKGISVIPAIASAVLALNGIPRHSDGATFLNIGKMQAGEGRNILAEHGHLELEVRGETTALNQYMEDASVRILKGQADTFNCELHIDILGSSPSLVSTPALYEACHNLCREKYSDLIYSSPVPCVFRASEDASIMMERVKEHGGQAVYYLLPTIATASLHKPDYDFNEDILAKAVLFYCGATAMLME